MSKYMEEKAKLKAIDFLTKIRIIDYKMGLIPFETDEELKNIRSYFHSLAKTQFNKNHAEIIPLLNDNLLDIVNKVNNINQEQLEFEKENYEKAMEEQRIAKAMKHADYILANEMFNALINLYFDNNNNLPNTEDNKIINALIGNCKFEDYEFRILMKRLYARNINSLKFIDGKRTIPLENVFKNKTLSL